jgi:hypothetical protein
LSAPQLTKANAPFRIHIVAILSLSLSHSLSSLLLFPPHLFISQILLIFEKLLYNDEDKKSDVFVAVDQYLEVPGCGAKVNERSKLSNGNAV